MNYVEIEISCEEPLKEILTAELSQLGFESFLDTPDGLKAYLSASSYNPAELEQLISQYPQLGDFRSHEIVEENWNHQWESSFEPVIINHQCRIRASFHAPSDDYRYDIVIDPKMSFGTGHHETTSLMIKHILALNPVGSRVLDVGCGTGVLSILAEKIGASQVIALDIDVKAVVNTRENILLNHCGAIEVQEGTVADLARPQAFQLVTANINRNVLLADIPQYAKLLTSGGHLIVSGFYTEDQAPIVNTCEANDLQIKAQNQEQNWASLVTEKN